MSRNHTFLTRGLAVVMALVMIVSCANLGMALPALAADNGESLYALIAKSDVGTPALRAVLAAGGLPGDQTITYTEPSEADAEALLRLKNGTLNAESFHSGIEGNPWVPYSYGAEGSENLFSGNSAEWNEETVNVIYALNLGSDIVAEPLEMAAELANEAGVQNQILRNFYDTYQDNLKSMRKGVLNGLKDEVEYAPAMPEVKNEFISVIDGLKGLINDETGYLNFYHTLEEYQTEGLAYYYANWESVVSEIADLSVRMNALVNTQEKLDVLAYLCDSVGYAGYADKFVVLADALVEASNTLKAPNSKIDLSNEKLVSALDLAMGVQEYETKDLVLYSTNLYVLDSTYAYVIVTVNGPAGYKTVPVKFENGGVISVEEVYAQVEATAASMLGEKAPYYTLNASEIDALAGKTITKNVEITCEWAETEYTVQINKTADQTVTINDLTVTLPANTQEGHSYIYFIGDQAIEVMKDTTYTFTAAELDSLFVDGVLAIERLDHNYYRDGLEGLVAAVNEKVGRADAFVLVEGEEGDYSGLIANIEMSELAAFGEAVIMSDYTYIALDNTVFYDGEYVSVQALINALMNDDEFSNETLIALGQNGQGQFLHTTMQLAGYDLDFVLNLTAVPEQMTKVSKALDAVKDYMYFNGGEGYLDVTVTLPEKIYEGYLTAAIGSGYAEGDNLDAFKNTASVQFVADYFELLMNSDVTTTTFSNTLATVGVDVDLSDYEGYYQKVKQIANGEGFDYVISDSMVDVSVAAGSDNIERVLNLLGLNSASIRFGTALIKDETLKAATKVTLTNDAGDFEALIINPAKVTENGAQNKVNAVDYTSDLVGTLASMNGKSMVILLDDVYGSLNFPGAAIIDLNGNTVHGDINVNGSVIIVDSAMDTYNGGAVTGSVSAYRGVATGGTYGSLDAKFLKDGYILDNGSVRNALYYVTNNGKIEFALNAEFYNLCNGYLPSVKALAVEISSDLAMAMYPAVGMAYGSETIYGLNIDNILDSYLGGGVEGAVDALITDACGSVNAAGINALANDIIDDLCDLKAVAAALNNEETIASYGFSVYPIGVDFNYNSEADIVDFSIIANTKAGKSFNVAVKVEGDNKYYAHAKEVLTAMSEVVTIDAQVELAQPTYNASSNTLKVAGSAYGDVTIDLSADSFYTKAIAIMLAYGSEEWADEIAEAKNCVVILNTIISEMTVEDVFTALKVMSRDVSIIEMADAIGYKYPTNEIAALEEVYHVLLCAVGEGLDLNFNAEAPDLNVVNSYTKTVATILAYTSEDLSDEVANAKDTAVALKNIIAKLTRDDVITALKQMNGSVSIEEMCDAIGYEPTGEELAEMKEVYAALKEAAAKALADLNLSSMKDVVLEEARNTVLYAVDKAIAKLNSIDHALNSYLEGTSTYTYSRTADADKCVSFKGYTGIFEVTSLKGSVSVKLAPKCTGLLGDADWDGYVTTFDAALILEYMAELITENDLHLCVCDVDGDGAVTTFDAACILEFKAELIDRFPAEEN